MFRTLSLGDSISVALRKLLQGGRSRGVRPYTTLQQRSRQPEHHGSGVKLRNSAFYVWEDAKLWAHWIHSFQMQLSCLGPNSVSLFTLRSGRWLLPAVPQLLSSHHGGWQHLLGHSLGSPHSHLETRNHWWLWHFLFIDMAGDIFISQRHSQHEGIEASWLGGTGPKSFLHQ